MPLDSGTAMVQRNLFGTVLAQLKAKLGQMEQQFWWEVLYNLNVLHVGA
jgi:hypothetical protein